MKIQDTTPLVKEICNKLSELPPSSQEYILTFMNELIEVETRKNKYKEKGNNNNDDFPSPSKTDLKQSLY